MPRAKAKTTVKKTKKRAVAIPQETTSQLMATEYPKNISTKKPQFFIGLAIIIILIGVAIYFLKNWFIVATVNGQPITRIEFNKALEAQAGKQVLTTMITEKLIFQEAEKKGVTVSQSEVDAAMKQVTDSLSKQGQTLDQALALQGMTKAEFADRMKIQKLIEKMFANDIQVSEQEVDAYLEQNKDTLPQDQKPEDIRASVKTQLKQQKLSAKFQAWLQTIQKNAKITQTVTY